MINLTSDTLTKPTEGMLRAMMAAEVGDDVFSEDPTVNRLEAIAAERFGKEAAVFCPSGTMTNQIALKIHTRPLDEVVCDVNSHIYQYEVGGYAFHSGIAIQLLEGSFGKITAPQVGAAIRPDQTWLPRTRLVVLENTCNRGGGGYYHLHEVNAIGTLCRDKGLAFHLDGARLFNALTETGESTEDWGAAFDTLSICLSKGLGAPVGSLLLGSREHIHEARRVRKAMGGGMRQAGYLAAAGIYALENHVERLREDHLHAQWIGEALRNAPFVTNLRPVMSNIILFDVQDPYTAKELLGALEGKGIRASGFGPKTVRFVTHLDISESMARAVCQAIGELEL